MRFRSFASVLVCAFPCFAQLQLNSGAVDTTKFRVTQFKTDVTTPLGMTTLSDGSIAIGTGAGILRFTDPNHTGIASGPNATLLATSGTHTALLKAGNFYLDGNDLAKTMSVLQPGATPDAPLQTVGTLQLTYPDGWQHNTIGFGVRAAPGQPGFYDLAFNVGTEFEHTASVDQVTLSGLASGMLDGDSLYAITLDLTGATPVASNLRKIASGIRNVVGFAFHPVTGDFYFVDNAINGPGADGDEPPQADELNFISAANFGVTVPNFGYPDCYIQYRTGAQVGSGCVYPLFAFQPLPNGTMLGSESEGPVQMTFAPSNFPAGLNNGIFVGFGGKGTIGTANEENAVGYYSLDNGSYIHFSENSQPGVGMPIGLLSTTDSLYIADYSTGTVYQVLGSPQLSITKTHVGSFAPGQQNATYTLTVSNAAGADDVTGVVTVTETVPSGLTLVSMTGAGWNCMSNTCTASSSLTGGQSYPAITATVNVAMGATSPQVNQASVSGGGSSTSSVSDSTVIAPPLLTVVKSHSGNFFQGESNATFTITVGNMAAAGPTSGMVTVTDSLPSGLSLIFMSGTGWTCQTNTCSRSDVLSGGASYPDITVTVNVKPGATSPQVNLVNVTGGGSVDANNSDSALVFAPPLLTIAKSHTGNFVQSQHNATYAVTVSNDPAAGPTAGTVTVNETLPSGLTLVSMAGTGWTCLSVSCTRNDSLGAGLSYPPITVTVNVNAGATSPQLNQVSVSGGGSAQANSSDSTMITQAPVLTITKSHTGNFFQGQQNATYLVSVSNTAGGATSGTVSVTDSLPVGLSFVSMTGTGWSCPATTCTRSDSLGSGFSYPPITVTVNVGATASSPQVNQVGITGGSAASANTSDSTIIAPPPLLTIAKSHTGNFTQGQQNVTYLVTVSNTTGASATSGQVTVTDTLPSGLTLVSMAGGGWTCISNSCTRSDALIGGANYPSITVTANVGASATSPQVNQVSVSGGNSVTANASDSTVIIGSTPILTITKTHSGNFTQGQQNATYSVTVANTALAGPTSGVVTVTETVPAGLTLVSMSGTGWTCPSNTCTRSDVLTGGSSYPALTVTVNVGASATSPQVNQVSVSGGNSATANASDSTVITPNPPVLTITKSHTGNFTQGQLNATYTVTVANTAATGPTSGVVTVTETVPSGLTFVSMAGTGWTCPSNTCTRSDVLNGGSSSPAITVTVNVGASATSPQVNQVNVSGGGSVTANGSDSTVINPKPVLTITKSHTGSFTQGQQNATYTITVANTASAGPTFGVVTVTDTIPAGLTLISMAGTGWTCVANSCTRSDALNGGSSYPAITVTVNVGASATSPQVNQAGVSGGGSASANASDSTVIIPSPVLTITKSHTGNFTQGQQNAAYTVTVSNTAGTGATSGVATVTDTVPAGLTLVSMAGTGWTCVSNTCTRGDTLVAGSSYPAITVTVNVGGSATSPQVNQVSVSGASSTTANGSDSTVIIPKPVLTITKSHAGNFTQGQQSAAYTITVSNGAAAGPTTGTVTVTETAPSGLALVSVAGTGWTCVSNTCTRGDALAGGSSYPAITATVNVGANATSPQVNQVSVSGGGSVSASASDSTVIAPKAPVLTISKSHAGNFAQGQQNATYAITVSNTAASGPTTGTVTVTDTVPSGLTLASISGAGWTCVSATCTRNDVLNGGSSYPVITATVNVGASATSPQVNQASVSGGGSSTANASDSTVIGTPLLSITSSHAGSFVQGQQNATYTVTVSNGSAGAATSAPVTVSDILSSGQSLVSISGSGWICVSNLCGRTDVLNPGASYPVITVKVNVSPTATSPQTNQVSVSGGGSATATFTDSSGINANPPVLTIAKSHTGNFAPGQPNATYSITVSNSAGTGPTLGTVIVAENPPSGLTLVSMAGTGWTCVANACTRSDALSGGASYPAITATVNVSASAGSPQVNQATVSGGGSSSSSASDSTVIGAGSAQLSIAKAHSGNFTTGQQNAVYTLTVSNSGTASGTSGTVTVSDTVPSGMTLVSMSGTGWNCASNNCTRTDGLAAGASYPAITVIVSVASNATSPLVNHASVSGGGSATANASDSTVININQPTLGVNRSSLNFDYNNGLITPPQQVIVTFTGGVGIPWTASSNQSNITVSPASGNGNGTFQVTATAGSSGVVTVTAPGATNSPKQIQINVASVAPSLPFGSFDTPANNISGVAGAIAVTGWALDNVGLSSVGIWRERVGTEPVAGNGLVFIGNAVFVADARSDIQTTYPTAPDNYRAGWGYLLLTNFLPNTSGAGATGNGTYKLHAIAVNTAGQSFDLGTHSITVDNADAARPFGTLDTPDQGGTVSATFTNFGWALTQNPFMIPFDGSTITVVVDGVTLGHPTYNQFRSDIANAFPGLANSNGAIGYFFIDTTLLSNGVHTIDWLVFDNQGRGDGIGSRFFNILNPAGGTVAALEEPVEAVAELKLRRGAQLAMEHGVYRIQSQELDRIELEAGAAEAYLIVDGQQLPLPAGATLKAGVFYWQLAAGYLGHYEFLLIRPDGHRIPVQVTISPKAY